MGNELESLKNEVARAYALGFKKKELIEKFGITPLVFEKWVRDPEFVLKVKEWRKVEYEKLIAKREQELTDIFDLISTKAKELLTQNTYTKKEVQELNTLLKEFREFLKIERKILINEPDLSITTKNLNVNLDIDVKNQKDEFLNKIDKELLNKILWDNSDKKRSEE